MNIDTFKQHNRLLESADGQVLSDHIATWYRKHIVTGTHETILGIPMRVKTEAGLDLTPCSAIPDAILLPDGAIEKPTILEPIPSEYGQEQDYFRPEIWLGTPYRKLSSDVGELDRVEMEIRYQAVVTQPWLSVPLVTTDTLADHVRPYDDYGNPINLEIQKDVFSWVREYEPPRPTAVRIRYISVTGQVSEWSDFVVYVITAPMYQPS